MRNPRSYVSRLRRTTLLRVVPNTGTAITGCPISRVLCEKWGRWLQLVVVDLLSIKVAVFNLRPKNQKPHFSQNAREMGHRTKNDQFTFNVALPVTFGAGIARDYGVASWHQPGWQE